MALVKSDPRYRSDNRFVFTSTIMPAEWLQPTRTDFRSPAPKPEASAAPSSVRE